MAIEAADAGDGVSDERDHLVEQAGHRAFDCQE